jgi:hypothetical protein
VRKSGNTSLREDKRGPRLTRSDKAHQHVPRIRAAGSADVEGHYFVFLGFGRPYFGRAAHPRR